VPEVSLRLVLEAAAELDSSGGASLALIAWELCVEEHDVAELWERAIAHGLLKPSGHDTTSGEQLWRDGNPCACQLSSDLQLRDANTRGGQGTRGRRPSPPRVVAIQGPLVLDDQNAVVAVVEDEIWTAPRAGSHPACARRLATSSGFAASTAACTKPRRAPIWRGGPIDARRLHQVPSAEPGAGGCVRRSLARASISQTTSTGGCRVASEPGVAVAAPAPALYRPECEFDTRAGTRAPAANPRRPVRPAR
jgi:hypothetical protein